VSHDVLEVKATTTTTKALADLYTINRLLKSATTARRRPQPNSQSLLSGGDATATSLLAAASASAAALWVAFAFCLEERVVSFRISPARICPFVSLPTPAAFTYTVKDFLVYLVAEYR
jgi:hypothetical protein